MLTLEAEDKIYMSTDRPETFTDWLEFTKNRLELKEDRQLAEKLGLSPSILSYLFAGRRPPTAMHIAVITKNLNIPKKTPEYCELLELAQEAQLSYARSQRRHVPRPLE
jgi:transcriptional regulator with XRE-family HTH domain